MVEGTPVIFGDPPENTLYFDTPQANAPPAQLGGDEETSVISIHM